MQPDGKIVVAGGASPGFGMLARLDPDGGLDPSFGDGGIAIDRTSTPFTELVIQPDGKIVALNAWMRLKRYEADGSPDLGFGEAGVGVRAVGIVERPSAIVLLPDGRIALGGNYHVKMFTHQALAYVYAADGRSVEAVGKLGPVENENWPGGLAGTLNALAPRGDGSLLMAGFSSPSFNSGEGGRSVLARFVPGAGSPYDPAFGGGAGLVTVPYPGSLPALNALVPTPGGIYAAGAAANHLVLAHFSDEGALDGGFGSNGFADVSPGPGFSQGNDLAVQPDGKIIVAGEVNSQKGQPGANCTKCRRPLLLRFLSGGTLDPGFGEGGVVQLTGANESRVPATASTVASLPDGRALIAGRLTSDRFGAVVARVQQDGRLDPGFGEGGTATVDACPGNVAAQRRGGCLPSLRARLRVRHGPRHRVALDLDVRPNLEWASVTDLELTLPGPLRAIKGRGRRIKTTLVESDGNRRSVRVAVSPHQLGGGWTIGPKSISLAVPASVLQRVKEVPAGRRLPFRVNVRFGGPFFGYDYAGAQEIVLRRAIG